MFKSVLKQWYNYFKGEFSSPDPLLESKFEKELDGLLLESANDLGFVVTPSMVTKCILKLRKKTSRGADSICAKHLEFGSCVLVEHLSLLYQMIFVTGIVPNLFSTGLISPILKKGKPADCCSSFRPITVSPFYAKYLSYWLLMKFLVSVTRQRTNLVLRKV